MKKIILGILLLFNAFAFSQEKIEITKDGLTNTEQVIKLDSLTAKEIYSRINKYIQKNYANPNAVSKGNIENEFISFNGLKKDCIVRKILMTTYPYSLEYFFNIDIKDGKIKITLIKALATENGPITAMNPINYFNITPHNLFKSDGVPRSPTICFVNGFNENINFILTDLVASIKNDKSNW